jgi:hypothetical protein
MSDDKRAEPNTETVSAGHEELSVATLLAGARHRLERHPSAIVALLVAGVVVIGIDWVQLHDPVPTKGYEGIQQGRVAASFTILVRVFSRADVPMSALVDLKPRWLALTVGLELLQVLVITLASAYALARVLDIDLSTGAVGRYGLILLLLEVGPFRANFEGGGALIGLLLIVPVFVVMVRLVPLPALLIRGDSITTAVGRSWTMARGHGWTLFGVVLVLGIANHLSASIPLVGPLGTAAVAAVHVGVLATLLNQLESPETPRKQPHVD